MDEATARRLAFLLYVRCGDRSVATAREDAAVILRDLDRTDHVPDWFADEYAALSSEVPSDAR